MPSFGIIIEALTETNQTVLFVHNTVLTHVVRENSMCIYLVIFNAATDGDKPVKRRVKYDNVREQSE